MSSARNRKRKSKVPAPSWRRHKDEVIQLYINDDETLERVMEVMRQTHAFAPTKAQYKRQIARWEIQKNKKSRVESDDEKHATGGMDDVSDTSSGHLSWSLHHSQQRQTTTEPGLSHQTLHDLLAVADFLESVGEHHSKSMPKPSSCPNVTPKSIAMEKTTLSLKEQYLLIHFGMHILYYAYVKDPFAFLRETPLIASKLRTVPSAALKFLFSIHGHLNFQIILDVYYYLTTANPSILRIAQALHCGTDRSSYFTLPGHVCASELLVPGAVMLMVGLHLYIEEIWRIPDESRTLAMNFIEDLGRDLAPGQSNLAKDITHRLQNNKIQALGHWEADRLDSMETMGVEGWRQAIIMELHALQGKYHLSSSVVLASIG